MSDMTDRLEAKIQKEIRYARGMEVMQRERYVEYCRDLRAARKQGDRQRTREIIQDLSAFADETRALMQAHRRAYERLFTVRFGEESAASPPPGAQRDDTPATATAPPGSHAG
jgi:hypothetical protein